MPQCLTIKRCVKVKLSKSVSKKSKRKPLSCWKMFKYRWSMGFTKVITFVVNCLNIFLCACACAKFFINVIFEKYYKLTKYLLKKKTYCIHMKLILFQLKINIRDLAYSFELWYEPLKKIEGNFGTGVASFFKFLRWLFLVNLTIAIVSTSFIVIPKVIYNPGTSQSINWNIMSDLITGEVRILFVFMIIYLFGIG